MRRVCAHCSRQLPSDSFSVNQWALGAGKSMCYACRTPRQQESNFKPEHTARLNNATGASFSQEALESPFASGSFKYVTKGVYTKGERSGQPCVCKWFKQRSKLEDEYFRLDMYTVKETIRIVTMWNKAGIIDQIIQVNKPEIWTWRNNGMKSMLEPFIENYQKFNSNSGWSDDSLPWPRVMQALSHYSNHVSKGRKLLCDLQGGVYNNGAVLTDPAIVSVDQSFGPTDLGLKGIHSFFARHTCNEFCSRSWLSPGKCKAYFKATAGTSMIKHVPHQQSRRNMSAVR